MTESNESFVLAKSGEKSISLGLSCCGKRPALLAAQRLAGTLRDDFGCRLAMRTLEAGDQSSNIVAACPPWGGAIRALWKEPDTVSGLPDSPIRALAEVTHGDQGFVVTRIMAEGRARILLAANTPIGLKNSLLTLGDRLYRDANGNIVVDDMDGVHRPAFERRHMKTDAMNCGPFRSSFSYWDATTDAGIDEFADWLASLRLTDYDLLVFMRGWGLTYRSERFPGLVDPQHPNPRLDYYPRLIERLHNWGMRVWGADVYVASGYSMETGMCPEMLSPCADAGRLKPFVAGKGSFSDILYDPEAVVCLNSPAARTYYAEVVKDILQCNPALDGLDFHTGHTFPRKICRCPECQGLTGNREGVRRCFSSIYEAALRESPRLRLRTAVKMFGDATRHLADHHAEFPQLEFFCWLRWAGNLIIERTDAPVTTGHEDGGGGLEMNHDPGKTLDMIRDYWRDYEPWIRIYVQIARAAGLSSFSWEPALHREIENQMFVYSQLTWEPELSHAEFARRFVIRSERRLDAALIEAYRLALEINAAVTSWGLAPNEYGCAQRVVQVQSVLETRAVREKLAALRHALERLGLLDASKATPSFDLRRSLSMTLKRMEAGQVLGQWH